MMLRRLTCAFVIVTGLAAVPCRADDGDAATWAGIDDWRHDIRQITTANRALGADENSPLAAPMDLCFSPGCAHHRWVRLTPDDIDRVADLFATPAIDAAQERQRLARAIGLFETLVAPQLGTADDHPGNDHRQDEDSDHLPGQLDCVAETINTATYLDRLSMAGWLHHHSVGPEVIRFSVILQHIAVKLVEYLDEHHWVVDSWPNANGEDAEIVDYDEWRGGWRV